MQTYGIFFNFQLSFWKFLFVAVNYAVSMRKTALQFRVGRDADCTPCLS